MSEPVLITVDDDGETYLHDQLTHFFNTISYDVIRGFSPHDKDRYFDLITNHEDMIANLYGNSIVNSIIFLPRLFREGIDNELMQEYVTWLEKQ
jgi:hypothetical protein